MRLPSRIFHASIAALLLTTTLQGARAAERAAWTLPEIITRVQKNEALYVALDATLLRSYTNHSALAALESQKTQPKSDAAAGLIVHSTEKSRIRCVLQGRMFRVEREGDVTGGGRELLSAARIRASDGEVTRLYDRKASGQIIQGRAEDELIIRPHMCLLEFMRFRIPLSAYLSGREAMRDFPGSSYRYLDYPFEVEYRGTATFKGLTCHRVWITTSAPEPHDRWELWLVEERNFIPVRNLGYVFRFDKANPVSEGEVREWRELRPGVWFPAQYRTICYDRVKPLAPNVRVPQWTDRISSKTSLSARIFRWTTSATFPFPSERRWKRLPTIRSSGDTHKAPHDFRDNQRPVLLRRAQYRKRSHTLKSKAITSASPPESCFTISCLTTS